MSITNDDVRISLQSHMKLVRDSLIDHQRAMGVVANNVSNLNTEGYHRQRADMEACDPMDGKPGQIGTGARLQQIQRLYDNHVENQLREETGNAGRWAAQYEALGEVEKIFDEINTYSISNAMDEFWNAWEDLANDVDSVPSRINLLNKSQDLASAFHGTAKALEGARESLNLSLQGTGDKINTLASSVADYNKEIIAALNRGQNPNTLRDKRDQLVVELSRLAGVTVQEEGNGSLTVYIGREVLVHRDRARKVGWVDDSDKGKSGGDLIWTDTRREINFESGEAAGKLEVRDELIPRALNDLDLLATTLRDRVNELHKQGVGMDGTSGYAFWREDTRGAVDLALNDILLQSPEKIAASRTSPTGDNGLAHEIFELRYERAMNGGRSTFAEFYQDIVNRIAGEVDSADTRRESSEAGLLQAQNWQQEVSGVNLDEEMAVLLGLQRAYTANGRVLMKLDEMTTVILMMAR